MSTPHGAPTALHCPSCGAALPDGGQRRECVYCGTIVELPRHKTTRGLQPPPAPPARLSSSSWSPVAVTIAKTSARSAGCAGMIGTLALLVTIAVIAIAALVVTDHPIVGSLTGAVARATPLSATERAVALSAPGEAGLQTVAAVVRDGENAYRVALLDPATNKRMWTSEPVGDTAISYGQFAWNADTLVFVDERSVHSFKRSDGTLNWKTTLSDRVCPDCLALAGSSVVALTIDNQLAGIDLASGEVLWKQGDLRSIERRLMPFDTAVAILADDDSGDRQVFVFDAETGTLRSNIALVCSQAADETAIEASSSDAAWYDDGMLTLYSSFSDTCIHSYDLRSGRQRWQQIIPREQALQSSMATSMRVLGSDLYIGGYGGLLATSLADGTTRMVAQNKEFAYEALALHDTSLVAGMTRIVGTQRRELWGLDTTSGKTLWKQSFNGEGDLLDYDNAGTIGKNEQVWTWTDTPAQFALVTMTASPNTITITTLDPHTGQAAPSSATIGRGEDTFWRPTILARRGAVLLLEDDTRLVALDTVQGAITYTGP